MNKSKETFHVLNLDNLECLFVCLNGFLTAHQRNMAISA